MTKQIGTRFRREQIKILHTKSSGVEDTREGSCMLVYSNSTDLVEDIDDACKLVYLGSLHSFYSCVSFEQLAFSMYLTCRTIRLRFTQHAYSENGLSHESIPGPAL